MPLVVVLLLLYCGHSAVEPVLCSDSLSLTCCYDLMAILSCTYEAPRPDHRWHSYFHERLKDYVHPSRRASYVTTAVYRSTVWAAVQQHSGC
jgi:hypothetical protein